MVNSPIEVLRRPTLKSPSRPEMVRMASWPVMEIMTAPRKAWGACGCSPRVEGDQQSKGGAVENVAIGVDDQEPHVDLSGKEVSTRMNLASPRRLAELEV